MNKKKILIISHNPMGNEDNMGITLSNIFKEYEKDELCQIYLKNQNPNFSICGNYFYINESSVFKSFFSSKNKIGTIIIDNKESVQKKNSSVKEGKLKEIITNFARSRIQLTYLFRNFIWNRNKWFSDELKEWLKDQKPSCIFFAAGDYTFSMNMAIKISEYLKIPLYSYYVDEYYLYKKTKQIIPIESTIYRKKFKELVKKSSMGFCISEMMKDEYEKLFKRKFEVLSNTCLINDNGQNNNNDDEILKMYYFGNISFNRWKGLSELSTAINKLNKQYNKKIIFEIYSGEKDTKLIKQLTANNDVNFKGSITQEEVNKKMKNANILLHTESFDLETIGRVKYSISTKIPSLLASNKIIIAYGPSEIESIDYLKRNDAAVVITNKDELEKRLEILYSYFDFSKMKRNAKRLVQNNHSPIFNKKILDKYFTS